MKYKIVRAVIYNGGSIIRESSSFDMEIEEQKNFMKELYNHFKKVAFQNGWGAKLVNVPNQKESEITDFIKRMREFYPDYELGTFDPKKVR